jgi:hypothetical protein
VASAVASTHAHGITSEGGVQFKDNIMHDECMCISFLPRVDPFASRRSTIPLSRSVDRYRTCMRAPMSDALDKVVYMFFTPIHRRLDQSDALLRPTESMRAIRPDGRIQNADVFACHASLRRRLLCPAVAGARMCAVGSGGEHLRAFVERSLLKSDAWRRSERSLMERSHGLALSGVDRVRSECRPGAPVGWVWLLCMF